MWQLFILTEFQIKLEQQTHNGQQLRVVTGIASKLRIIWDSKTNKNTIYKQLMAINPHIEWTQVVKCQCEPNFHVLSKWITHFFREHIKTLDGKNFKCKFCDDEHNIITAMTHTLEKHTEIAYFCNNCEEEFYTLEALKLHVRCDCEGCGFPRCRCLTEFELEMYNSIERESRNN